MSKIVSDQGGEVTAAGRWDKRRLAYEIKGFRDGLYCLMYFTGESHVPKELDRLMKISDDIIRHIILKVEEQYVDPTRIIYPAQPVEAAPAPEATEAVEASEAASVEVEVKAEEVVTEAAPEPAAEEVPAAPEVEVESEEKPAVESAE